MRDDTAAPPNSGLCRRFFLLLTACLPVATLTLSLLFLHQLRAHAWSPPCLLLAVCTLALSSLVLALLALLVAGRHRRDSSSSSSGGCVARVLLLALNVGRLTGPLKALSCLVGVELLPLLLLDPSVGAEEDAHEEDREGGASTLRISHRGLCPDTCKPCSQQFSFELAEDAVMLYAVSDAVFLGLPMLAIQLAFLFYNHDQIHNPILLTSIGFSAFSAAFLTHVDVDVSESSSVLGKMFAVLFFTSHLGIKLLSWILLSQTIGYLLIFLLLVDWAISVVAVLLAWKYATPGGAVFSASVMGKALLYGVLNVFLFQPFSGQYTGPGLTAPARYRFTRVTTRGGKSKVRKRKVASPVKLPKKRSVDTSTSATGSSSLADSLPQSAERHIFAVDARSWWIVLKHILVNGLMTLLVLGTYRTPASANQQVPTATIRFKGVLITMLSLLGASTLFTLVWRWFSGRLLFHSSAVLSSSQYTSFSSNALTDEVEEEEFVDSGSDSDSAILVRP